MDGLYGLIQNIVYYLIFVTVIVNLLPAGKYEKYLRLFAGCILILLVLQPVTGGLRLEDKIAGIFRTLSFENELGELNVDLEGMESRRMDELVKRYEEAAAEDIERMADAGGFESREVSVEIDRETDSPDFGKIRRVTVCLRADEEEAGTGAAEAADAGGTGAGETGSGGTGAGAAEAAGKGGTGETGGLQGGKTANSAERIGPVENIKPVERITVGAAGADGDTEVTGGTGSSGGTEASGEPPSSKVSAPGIASGVKMKRLQQEIASYYQVEEQYVEIRLENE